MPSYLEFRCPNTPQENSTFECRRELAGPSLDTLQAHDFDKAPFQDTRYCVDCGILWSITIPSLDAGAVAEWQAIEKGERVDFRASTEAFKFTVIRGQRAR